MKIHYFASSTLISDSANSVHVTKMSKALCTLGHEVTLHGQIGTGSDEDVLRYYDVADCKGLSLARHDESTLSLNGFLKKLKQLCPFLPLGGLPSLLYGARLKDHLPHDLDLIYARNMYWLFSATQNDIPFVYESHSPPQNFFQKWVETQILKRPNCKGLVVISAKLKEIYLDLFPHIADKILVAHDGADDPGEEKLDLAVRETREFKTIGYVGHLYKGRGIEIILGAAERLPHMDFHVVGGKAEAIEELKKCDLPRNITFHGHQPPEKLHEYFRSFDAVLAPYQRKIAVSGNRGDTSAFMSPLKIFEYMSWGFPILCSDLPVLHEVLHPDDNAIMLPPDDVESWVRALEKLETDQDFRHGLAQRARNDFLTHYSWQERARQILSAL